ncbi:hypothetical protein ABPG73_022087 [Tetrahymena malaccensis]
MNYKESLGLSPSHSPTSERIRLDKLFVAQHSSCFQKELNQEYNLKQNVCSSRKKRNQQFRDGIQKVDTISYQPRESRKSQQSDLKQTFQRAHLFQESPLSIKHLDSLVDIEDKQSQSINAYKSIHNESSLNLKQNFKDLFKTNSVSVEVSPKNNKRRIKHFNLNDKSLQFQLVKEQNQMIKNKKNMTQDEDFFFTTASIDYCQDDNPNQHKRVQKKKFNDLYHIQQTESIQRYHNNSVDSTLIGAENRLSLKNINQKSISQHENYQDKQSKKLLRLPKLQNNLSKSLLQSYEECQNSMDQLINLERSISQKSIYQYDLALPQNQEKLFNQKKRWENRALEYINEKKYQNFQDRKEFKIFNEGIDRRIHRYYIDEEQRRKNILVQKMEKIVSQNQKINFINQQRIDNFKNEQFYKKFGIHLKEKQNIISDLKEDNHLNLYSPQIDKKAAPPSSSARASPNTKNSIQIKFTNNQLPNSNSKRQSQEISYTDLIQDESYGSLNEMLSNKLSSISYQKRKQNSKQQDVYDTIKILQNLPHLSKINYPSQEFPSISKKDNSEDQTKKTLSPVNEHKILKEEFVDLNSPLSYQKNRKQFL